MEDKLTIHRALTELKTISDRITKAIDSFLPIGVKQGEGDVNQIYKTEDFTKNAESKYQSIKDLIERQKLLKTEIVKSNSITKVVIAGNSMTVADAIVFKDVTITQKEKLLNFLKNAFKNSQASINRANEQVEDRLEVAANQTLGAEKIKKSPESYTEFQKMYRQTNQFKMVDPLNIEREISNLEKEIDDFKAEVDAKLSESNALTSIEV